MINWKENIQDLKMKLAILENHVKEDVKSKTISEHDYDKIFNSLKKTSKTIKKLNYNIILKTKNDLMKMISEDYYGA